MGRNSTPYFIVIALIFPRSGGPGGITLRSSNTFSNPPGTITTRVLPVVFPVLLKACGISFGRTTIAPLDPLNLLSPHWNSYSPSRTTNVSVSRVCLCGGAPCPGGVTSSDTEYVPLVISLDTLIVIVSAKTLHFFPSFG